MKLCGGIHPASLTVSFQGVLQTSHILPQRQFVNFFEPHHKSSFTVTMKVGLQALGWYLMAEPTDENLHHHDLCIPDLLNPWETDFQLMD